MKKFLALYFISQALYAGGHEISQKEFQASFKDYNACFILYNLNQNKIVSEYNPHNYCHERLSPNSSFKIALSLMAFNQGTINQNTVFAWDGKKGVIPEHEQNQTPQTWLKYSVLWVSQQITPKLGQKRIQRYLAGFNYGNRDFTGDAGKHNGLTHAWLSSSLKISAIEQLNFLKAMLTDELPISNDAIAQTKANLHLGKLDHGADIYGKTGSGRHGRNERLTNPSLLRDGWFIGFIQDSEEQYIFVSNLTDQKFQASLDKSDGSLKPYGSQILKPITMKLLNEYFKTNAT